MRLTELHDQKPKKSGFIPDVIEDGVPVLMLRVPSDPKYGGDKPCVAKGGIDPGEDPETAGIREAEEELGLKKSNLKMNTVKLAWKGKLTGNTETYIMTIYMGEVKSKKDFGHTHYDTGSVHWLTWEQYQKDGRRSQLNIIQAAHGLLSH